jgi:hypothetical protein
MGSVDTELMMGSTAAVGRGCGLVSNSAALLLTQYSSRSMLQ